MAMHTTDLGVMMGEMIEALPRVADADLLALDLGLMGLMGEMKVGEMSRLVTQVHLEVEQELERRVRIGRRVRK